MDNLCSMVLNDFPDLKSVKGYNENEAGLLNRLDNETGGLVLFAKTNDSFIFYSDEMKKGKIEKTYTAFVEGIPEEESGVITYPIAHHIRSKKKMVIAKENSIFRGKPREAKTFWKIIKIINNNSLLEIKIFKGARHQIRVHLAELGNPIYGDKIYNKIKYPDFPNQLLYSNGIKFKTYINNELIDIKIDVPFINLIL
jgi:23S rRNA pseudouridine1911/1915/1917 synthase